MTWNEHKLSRGRNKTATMKRKLTTTTTKKQLFFLFLNFFSRHTGSDTNFWYYSCAKNNRATTWIEPAIASNTDDYCGLDIHKLKTSFFFGSICGRWLSTERTRSRFTSVFFGPWASCSLCEVAELIRMKSCPFVLPFMFVFKKQTSHVCPSVVPKDLLYRFSSGQSPDAC